MFALKSWRFATNRRVLGEAGDSVLRFVNRGSTELARKLGAHRLAVRAGEALRPGRFQNLRQR